MKYKLGLCQMKGTFGKEENKKTAERMLREAAAQGAQVIALPEIWNCPYSNKFFREYSEGDDGPTVQWMSEIAKELNIYLIGGSIPELWEGNVYNTSYSFDRSGAMIGKHRKVHLFDINIRDGIHFMESETLTPGERETVLQTEFGKIGVAICYDVRFPELIRKMTLQGAHLVVLPAAFNMTTGPAHWDLTMRARALDNQIYFAAVSPARDLESSYHAFGGTCVANPWGAFVEHLAEQEGILIAEIDTDYVEDIRQQLPLLKHRRPELY